jgi:gamma-glutamyltranspeptidase
LLARVLVLGYDAARAVSAPRWVKHGPDGNLLAEEGLPQLDGATTIPVSDIAGHAHMIIRTDEGLDAGADPRADSLAAGH